MIKFCSSIWSNSKRPGKLLSLEKKIQQEIPSTKLLKL